MILSLVADDLKALLKKENINFFDFVVSITKSTGFQVVFLYRLSSRLRLKKAAVFSALIDRMILHFYSADIRSSAQIGGGFQIAHTVGIVIGGKVVAGRNLSIRQNTTLGGNAGKRRDGNASWTQPKIGDNVVVGCNSVIIGPIRVGDGARIGACTLVLTDVEEGKVCVGVPGKVIK